MTVGRLKAMLAAMPDDVEAFAYDPNVKGMVPIMGVLHVPTPGVPQVHAHMAKTSFTSVGSLADSPEPLFRSSPVTGHAA
jgi:hypothetical protein